MTNQTNLPPELQSFAAHLNAQPSPVQVAFQYALARLMLEPGKAKTRGNQ